MRATCCGTPMQPTDLGRSFCCMTCGATMAPGVVTPELEQMRRKVSPAAVSLLVWSVNPALTNVQVTAIVRDATRPDGSIDMEAAARAARPAPPVTA